MSNGIQIKEYNLHEPIQEGHTPLIELAQYLIKMIHHLIWPKDNQNRWSIILTFKPYIVFMFYFLKMEGILGGIKIRKLFSKTVQWFSIIHRIKYKDIYPYVIQPQATFHHHLSPLYLTIMHFRLAASLLDLEYTRHLQGNGGSLCLECTFLGFSSSFRSLFKYYFLRKNFMTTVFNEALSVCHCTVFFNRTYHSLTWYFHFVHLIPQNG